MSGNYPVSIQDIYDARDRMKNAVFRTPLVKSIKLGDLCGCELYFKLENLQLTGSFKDRGVSNKLAVMSADELGKGVAAASAGNHAQAVSYHCGKRKVRSTIVMPEGTPLIKVVSTQRYGAEVILFGQSYDDAYDHALEIAEERGLTFIPPYDDPWIIAGQGVVALEIMEDMDDGGPDILICCCGGGGLIGGIATAFKSLHPRTKIVGVQAQAVPGMIASLQQGSIVRAPAATSLADGIAVRQVGALTFELAKAYVDQWTSVNEEQIANAVLLLLENEKTVAEGAGAVSLAALVNRQVDNTDGKRVVCVISGGNIDVNIIDRIIMRGLTLDGRIYHFRAQMPDKPGQLAGLLEIIKSFGANILEIDHNREFNYAPFGFVQVDITLETKGHGQIREFEAVLREKGYKFNSNPPRVDED